MIQNITCKNKNNDFFLPIKAQYDLNFDNFTIFGHQSGRLYRPGLINDRTDPGADVTPAAPSPVP